MWDLNSEFTNVTVISLVLTLAFIYRFFQNSGYDYWKKKGVPCEKPPWIFGSVPLRYVLGKISPGNLLKEHYEKFKDYPFFGICIYQQPVFVANDPELVKIILVKEFARFSERGLFINEKIDPMTDILFLQKFHKWKRLRGKFSPAFAPSKLKQFYPLMAEIADNMVELFNKKLEVSDTLEIKDILGRYFNDVIASVVYGFNCDSLKDEHSQFRYYGKKAYNFGKIKMLLSAFLPEVLTLTGTPFFHKDVVKFFDDVFHETVKYRRENNIVRTDFLNVLMQMVDEQPIANHFKSSDTDKQNYDRLSLREASAQAFNFFIAGFETSLSTSTHCLLELSMNPEIQAKLQEEIDECVESEAGLTYDSIMGLEYLDMVLHETTRKHSAIDFLNRICTEDYQIPHSDYTIPKGMRILISNSGIQCNYKHWPDPEKFDPQRFNKKNPEYRDNPAYLAFGDGPRNCIAARFGLLQLKQALISLLYNYTFELSDKTKIPIVYGTESNVLTPKYGIYMRVQKRMH